MAVVLTARDGQVDPSGGTSTSLSRAALSTTVLVGGALVIAVAAFLPWIRSGSAWRSSFGLVRGLELVGFVHGAGARLLDLWYLAPAAVAGIWLAAVAGRRRLLVVLAASLLVGATALAVVVLRAPVASGSGPVVTLAGAGLLATGLALLALDRGAS